MKIVASFSAAVSPLMASEIMQNQMLGNSPPNFEALAIQSNEQYPAVSVSLACKCFFNEIIVYFSFT